MSVWIIRPDLPPEALEAMISDGMLVLPMDAALPDLSTISSPALLKQALLRLDPDAAPEAIASRQKQIWPLLQIHPEDIVAMKVDTQMICIGEVVERPFFLQGRHVVKMRWLDKQIALVRLGKYRKLFDDMANAVIVTDHQARNKLRSSLPHRRQRFARLRWIIGILVLIKIVTAALHFWGR